LCKSQGCRALFLSPLNVHEHAVETEYALLQSARLLGDLTRLGRRLSARLGLDHDVEVDELLSERAHVVLKAERIFSDSIGGEHIVTLALALAVEENLLVRILDFEVNVKRAAGLNLRSNLESNSRQQCVESTYSKVKLSTQAQRQYELFVELVGRRTPIFSPALSTSA
jgi:hypothetical protein